MTEQRTWAVACVDAVGRPRQLTVRARSDVVVLWFPAAGSATISPHRARALVQVLDLGNDSGGAR